MKMKLQLEQALQSLTAVLKLSMGKLAQVKIRTDPKLTIRSNRSCTNCSTDFCKLRKITELEGENAILAVREEKP